jgi:oxygen-independent coproporphyrinogen-3 oxidase
MAGIYIHIPFCKKACSYCNFHFSTSLQYRQQMTDAIIAELGKRKGYLNGANIESIYFGGGTPSTLLPAQIDDIFNAIHKHFVVKPDAEITFEANPDDVNSDLLTHLKSTPVNRFSMGVQSFFDEDLRWMNRAHTAMEAIESIKRIQDKGFDAISIDLIYGMPSLTNEHWEQNLHQAIHLNLEHISSYCLTVEPRTSLHHQVAHKKIQAPDEEQAAIQFEMLVKNLNEAGFEQYEISNFARKQKYAVHNTNYWKNKPYLGVGPSAHSFNQKSRQWNIASNQHYMKAIGEGNPFWEEEILTFENRVNEYIMTSLRTQWGLDKTWFNAEFGDATYASVKIGLESKIEQGLIEYRNNHYTIPQSARFLSDGIAADLFL